MDVSSDFGKILKYGIKQIETKMATIRKAYHDDIIIDHYLYYIYKFGTS